MNSLITACQKAKHIMFITGAGISVASGLPTYRGLGGIYTKSIIPPELLMTSFTLKLRPSLIWKHLHEVYKASEGVEPNSAHDSIAAMDLLSDRITVVTQNVDGLHKRAGSHEVIELHGTADSLKCTSCDYKDSNPDFSSLAKVPKCPECGSVLRPPVVLFGENLPEEAVRRFDKALEDGPDVIIAVGTTGNFPYITWPFEDGRKRGAFTAIIDPGQPKISTDIWVKEKAEDALPYLVGQMKAC